MYVPTKPDFRNLDLPAPQSDLTYPLFDDDWTIGMMSPHVKSRKFGSLLGNWAGCECNFFFVPRWHFLVRWFCISMTTQKKNITTTYFPKNWMNPLTRWNWLLLCNNPPYMDKTHWSLTELCPQLKWIIHEKWANREVTSIFVPSWPSLSQSTSNLQNIYWLLRYPMILFNNSVPRQQFL